MPKNKECDYYVSFGIGKKSSRSASKGLKKRMFILYTYSTCCEKDFKKTDLTASGIYETRRKIRVNFSIRSNRREEGH